MFSSLHKMKPSIIFLLVIAVGCVMLASRISQQERSLSIDLIARLDEESLIEPGDEQSFLTRIESVQDDWKELKEERLQKNLSNDTIDARIKLWDEMKRFFCTQDDAYLKRNSSTTPATKARVREILGGILATTLEE